MKLRFTPPPNFLSKTSLWVVLIGALIFIVACQEESDQLPVRMHSEGELLSKAQDYFDHNSTFGKSESNSARTINYGDYFPVWNKSKRVRKEKDFLIVPFHRRINREYGDQNYIRRLVFEYDTEGELTRAGVIELISGTFSLRQLAERHETIIDQYLKGNPSEGVGIVWSDVNMNELVGTAGQGLGVTISTEGNNSSRIAEANCTYYFWVLSDKLTGEILSVTFLYKECLPIGFTDVNPCGGNGLRMTSDPYEGDSLDCPEDSGSGGPTTLEDCEYLQMMGYDVGCVLEEEIIRKIEEEFGELNPCENIVVLKYPLKAYQIYKNSIVANQKTREIFGVNGHNDCSDAFRHAYWNFLNSIYAGSQIAEEFGTAHECDVPENLYLEKEMDLHNNAIGRFLASQLSFKTPEEIILEALQNGMLKVLNPLDSGNNITSETQLVSSTNICI